MTKIEANLRSDEYVLWQDKPKFAPFFLRRYQIASIIFGIFWLASLLFIFILPALKSGAPIEFFLFLILFALFPIISIFLPALLIYRNTGYIITNKRLLTQTGTRGLTKNFFNLEKIQEVNVKPGILDRLFKTGSIYLVVEGQLPIGPNWMMRSSMFIPADISSIKNPYIVQKKLEQAIYDAKKPKF